MNQNHLETIILTLVGMILFVVFVTVAESTHLHRAVFYNNPNSCHYVPYNDCPTNLVPLN